MARWVTPIHLFHISDAIRHHFTSLDSESEHFDYILSEVSMMTGFLFFNAEVTDSGLLSTGVVVCMHK